MTLKERISDYTKKEFESWEAHEVLIDDKRAMWSLQKPGSEYRKVCLYRDGKDMFIYGDYGQYTFDNMTWDGSVYNLEYENLGYQMEKLSLETKNAIHQYDENACEEDIYEWLSDRLENRYELDENMQKRLVNVIKSNPDYCDKALYWLQQHDLTELENLVWFVYECLENTDEYDWIPFLRTNCEALENFDEVTECDLWHAGERVVPNYYVSMYALQVCKEKLEKEREINQREQEREEFE